MTNLKRYEFHDAEFGDPAYMTDSPKGEFVKWEDYELLRKELDAVTKDRDDLQEKYNELVLSK